MLRTDISICRTIEFADEHPAASVIGTDLRFGPVPIVLKYADMA
jgi:hypothetical protein